MEEAREEEKRSIEWVSEWEKDRHSRSRSTRTRTAVTIAKVLKTKWKTFAWRMTRLSVPAIHSLLPETRLFFPLFLFPMFLFLAADASVSLILKLLQPSFSYSLCYLHFQTRKTLGFDPSQPETFPLLCTQRIQGPERKEKRRKKSSSADLNASFSRRRQRRRQSSFLLSLKRTTSILLWFLLRLPLRQSYFLLLSWSLM